MAASPNGIMVFLGLLLGISGARAGWLMVGLAACAAVLWHHARRHPATWEACARFSLSLALFSLSAFAMVLASALNEADRPGGLGMEAGLVRELDLVLTEDVQLGARGAWKARARIVGLRGTHGRTSGGAGSLDIELDLAAVRDRVGNPLAFRAGTRMLVACDRFPAWLETVRDKGKGRTWPLVVRLQEWQSPEGLAGLRAWVLGGLEPPGSQGRGGALWLALALGRQDLVEPSLVEAYYGSGCVHVLALSGMHLTLLAGILLWLLEPLVGRRKASLAGMVAAMGFVWLAGPYPSVLRALASFLVMAACARYRRGVDPLQALMLSLPLALLACPPLLSEPGFWLSCSALGGILAGGQTVEAFLRPWCKKFLASGLSGGLCATVASMPVMVAGGFALKPIGIAAGLVLAPLSLVHLALGAVLWPLAALGLAGGDGGRAFLDMSHDLQFHCALFFAGLVSCP